MEPTGQQTLVVPQPDLVGVICWAHFGSQGKLQLMVGDGWLHGGSVPSPKFGFFSCFVLFGAEREEYQNLPGYCCKMCEKWEKDALRYFVLIVVFGTY